MHHHHILTKESALTHNILVTTLSNVLSFPAINRLLQLIHFVQCKITVCSATTKPIQTDKYKYVHVKMSENELGVNTGL